MKYEIQSYDHPNVVTEVVERVVEVPEIVGRFAIIYPEEVTSGKRPLTYEEFLLRWAQFDEFFSGEDYLKMPFKKWCLGEAFHNLPPERGRVATLQEVGQKLLGRRPSSSSVYEYADFYRAFPIRERAEQVVREFAENRGSWSWHDFRLRYLRPDRQADADGMSQVEQAAARVDKAVQKFRSAEEEIEEAFALLPQDHPYRETAETALSEAREHLGAEMSRLMLDADTEDTRGPWRSPEYLDFVRSHACPWTGDMSPDAAHLGGWARGMSTKVSDAFAVPMSHELHMGLHNADGRWASVIDEGPSEWEVCASLMNRWMTGRNDGPVRLVYNL